MNELNEQHKILAKEASFWKAAFFGLIIFITGAVIGSSVTLIVAHKKFMQPKPGVEQISRQMVRRMKNKLELTAEQSKKIEKIISENMKVLEKIRLEAQPVIAERMNRLHEQVLSVLDDKQKAQWQAQMEQLQRRFDNARNRRGGGGDRGMAPGGGGGGHRRPFDFWLDRPKPEPPYNGPVSIHPDGNAPMLKITDDINQP